MVPLADCHTCGEKLSSSSGYLRSLGDLLHELGRATTEPVGIFGTSISATWLASAVGDKVASFVNEDANRIGREHMGRRTFGAADTPREPALLMPLRLAVAVAVAHRLAPSSLRFTISSLVETGQLKGGLV